MPFFTVVIPTYNHGRFIHEAINSVLRQTFCDFEIVIVDNASTDNTEAIVKDFIKNESRITYIRNKENLERSVSRNTGIKNATGKYVCFLDSDDYYLDNHLETFYNFIKGKNYPVGFFYSNAIREENGKLTKVTDSPINTVNAPTFMLQANLPSPRVCVHSEILNKYKFDEKVVMVEDTDLWMRIVSEYPMYYIDQHTIVYRIHEDNSTNIAKHNAFKARLMGLKIVFKKREAKSIPSGVKKREISNCYFGMAKYYGYQNQKLKMFFFLFRSILTFPADTLTKHKIYLMLTCLPGLGYLWSFFKKTESVTTKSDKE